jgi:teichuronic acid biosynthesis glycosyltransferase TuaC
MHVAIITKIFPSEAEPEAAPYNLNQFSALAALCDVTIFGLIPWFPGAALRRRFLGRGAREGPVVPWRSHLRGLEIRHPRVLYVPRAGRSLSGYSYAASLLPWLLPLRGQIDVLLGAFAFPDGWAATRLAQLLGVPAVIKVHGSDIHVQGEDAGLRPRLREALSAAVAVVGPSQPLIDRAVELGAAQATASVVLNGVDRSRFHPRERLWCRRQLGVERRRIADDDPIILSVGRLEAAKGTLDLLEAVAQLGDSHGRLQLVLVGDGVASEDCRRLAKLHRLSLHLVGRCDADAVALWLGACDVFALPSWSEGTPNVLIEALASGRLGQKSQAALLSGGCLRPLRVSGLGT